MGLKFAKPVEMLAAGAVLGKWLLPLIERVQEGIEALDLVIEDKNIFRYESGEAEPVIKAKAPGGKWAIDLHLGHTLAEFITVDREEVPARFNARLLDDGFAEEKMNALVNGRLKIVRALATSGSYEEVRAKLAGLSKGFGKFRIWEPTGNKRKKGSRNV